MLQEKAGPARCVYFVNAHTLNLAAADSGLSRSAQRGRLRLRRRHGRPLGRPAARPPRPRQPCRHRPGAAIAPRHRRGRLSLFPPRRRRGDDRAGRGHGRRRAFPAGPWPASITVISTTAQLSAAAIRQINRAEPDLLLVGMGNPRQEQWLHQHRQRAGSPVVPRRRRAVPLLGRRSPPAPPLALRRTGGRMAGHPLPAAAQGPPLSVGQSAVPLARSVARARRRPEPDTRAGPLPRPTASPASPADYNRAYERHLPGRRSSARGLRGGAGQRLDRHARDGPPGRRSLVFDQMLLDTPRLEALYRSYWQGWHALGRAAARTARAWPHCSATRASTRRC